MPYILGYTRDGTGCFDNRYYPAHRAYQSDWTQALHLAWSRDGKHFHPLRNNTAVLYARASLEDGSPGGVTQTLTEPWLFRLAAGGFGLLALRQREDGPDPSARGCVLLYTSDDLVFWREEGLLRLAAEEVHHPRCRRQGEAWRLYWETAAGAFQANSRDLKEISGAEPVPAERDESASFDVPECVPGNVIEISDGELEHIRRYLDEIRHVSVDPIRLTVPVGTEMEKLRLPGALCRYSDGSCHEKQVEWDRAAAAGADTSRPGTFRIPGRIYQKRIPFPIPLHFGDIPVHEIADRNMGAGMSDPCITFYRGRYYLSSTGTQNIALRCADRPEEVFAAAPRIIFRVPLKPGEDYCGTWAAELHEIGGRLRLLTAICPGGNWKRVASCVLTCRGDPMDPTAWEKPEMFVRRDGSPLQPEGISLDMTYFEDAGRHYVMWSDRKIYRRDGQEIIEPADIFIGTIDPEEPWRLTGDPVCLRRPSYGWERCETEVLEGPYLLRRGEELFVTVSASSTGFTDLYDVGLLRARSGAELLNPDSWQCLPWPLLTKESVPGEYGPGHNNFVTDRETGETYLVYHAVPHDGEGRPLGRQPAMRRLHWAASGLPYLEMTPERDLDPGLASVELLLTVEE